MLHVPVARTAGRSSGGVSRTSATVAPAPRGPGGTALLTREPAAAPGLTDLRRTVREICEDAGGPAAARRVQAAGDCFDAALWHLLCVRADLAAVGLPGSAGGRGGLAEVVAVCEELGRALLPVPFLSSTVLAGQVLARCGPRAAAALARVARGDRATLAVAGRDGAWDPAHVDVVADPQGVRLTGTVDFVLEGSAAELVVVAARSRSGVDLFLVDATAPGVETVAVEVDAVSRTQATLTFTGAPASRLTTRGTADAVLRPALEVVAVALAAEQLGGVQACLELAVEQVERLRRLGARSSAVAAAIDRCAETAVLVAAGREAVAEAVTDADDGGRAASVVRAWCAATYRTVTAEVVRLCGPGPAELAALYFRRARADAALLRACPDHGRQPLSA